MLQVPSDVAADFQDSSLQSGVFLDKPKEEPARLLSVKIVLRAVYSIRGFVPVLKRSVL